MRTVNPVLTFSMVMLLFVGGCSKPRPDTLWTPENITVTAIDVPDPAPVPWDDVKAYTERTYRIDANIGDEFAVGYFEGFPYSNLIEEGQTDYILELIDKKEVLYQPQVGGQYATEWFLFKAIATGQGEINFGGPINYHKNFEVTVK